MKIKNISNTVIGFGKVSVLPEEVAVVDDSFKNNDIVKTFRDFKFIEVIEDAPAKKEETKKGDKSSKKKSEPAPAEDSEPNPDEDSE